MKPKTANKMIKTCPQCFVDDNGCMEMEEVCPFHSAIADFLVLAKEEVSRMGIWRKGLSLAPRGAIQDVIEGLEISIDKWQAAIRKAEGRKP